MTFNDIQRRMIRLELQHSIAAIERALLIARDRQHSALPRSDFQAAVAGLLNEQGGEQLEAALAHLLETARSTLDLIQNSYVGEKEKA
jgi:hypothetical protein